MKRAAAVAVNLSTFENKHSFIRRLAASAGPGDGWFPESGQVFMSDFDQTNSGAIVPCWSCKGPISPRALFCATCGAVQPPGNINHFTRLGLQALYALDLAALDRQYFGFQRRLHPDRFATRSPKERALSQAQATTLNEAYETLKDPLKRAAYLLRLAGRSVDIEKAATVADPELLMEAMEMREALAEADSLEDVSVLAAQAEMEVSLCEGSLGEAFATDDLDAAGKLTTRLKYLGKLAEEARSRKIRMMRPGI
jgi:molecular chaperone HscB